MAGDAIAKEAAQFFHESSRVLSERLYEDYRANSKMLIAKIPSHKNLSRFDAFNKRFKLSWGMKIEFTDDLKITREDTRACYTLMLKISDLWFAFEHLVETASEQIKKDGNPASKVDFYCCETLKRLGFEEITTHVNCLMGEFVLCDNTCRREFYKLLAYLKNNTKGGTQKLLSEAIVITHSPYAVRMCVPNTCLTYATPVGQREVPGVCQTHFAAPAYTTWL